jgi:serine/threonine-protein kinase RsbT
MTTPPPDSRVVLRVVTERDLVALREELRKRAREVGMSLTVETKLITAGSELGRNMVLYAGGGEVAIEVVREAGRVGVQATFEDHGPGIADIALAMQDGYSTSRSLGMGLPGAKRLVDRFDIASQVGKGTRVQVVTWAPTSRVGTWPAP